MRKIRILPRLAITGVLKNGNIYFPYMGAGVFSVFVWFVFASILHNDIVDTLPRSEYAYILLWIGQVLLGLIVLPFLFYTNSFLIKRRKKEIGLYHILGLEKKHIGFLMLMETLFVYVVAAAGGIVMGIVFSKLIFLLLLNLAGLPVDARFQYSGAAFLETLLYFALVYGINFLANLWEVSRSKPVELLGAPKRGEKEPKRLWLPALLGAAALFQGYKIAVTSVFDGMIFTNFFLAVLLVAAGTYLLFISGSIVLLKQLKKRRKLYYSPEHFVTLSGMLYRMKKNAASLANICIFATMVIITLSCTLSLFRGNAGILEFNYSYDLIVEFAMHQVEREEIVQAMEQTAQECGVTLEETAFFPNYRMTFKKEGSRLTKSDSVFGMDNHSVGWLTLSAYNELMGTKKRLEEREALVFSEGPDWETEEVILQDLTFEVTEKLQDIRLFGKDEHNKFTTGYYIVVRDETVLEECIARWKELEGAEQILGSDEVHLKLAGEDEAQQAFIREYVTWCNGTQALRGYSDHLEQRKTITSMNGGLLFIGVMFGAVFLLCMILIMYYKQIAEGYEDRNNFEIMQKVGMGDEEIKRTVRTQVLLVFAIPLIGAVCHSMAGMQMVKELFGSIRMYDQRLIMECGVIVSLLVTAVYGFSYRLTAGAYYRIVRNWRRE